MNAPAIIEAQKPRTPVTSRLRDTLHAIIRDATPANEAAKLIPLDDCRAIEAEMDAALQGMAPDQGTAYARLIIGAYPAGKPDNPDVYVRMVAQAMCTCPPDLGMKAVDMVTSKHRFLPSKAEVIAVIDELRRTRHTVRQIARGHAFEHKRRGTDGKPTGKLVKDMTEEERAAMYAELDAKCPGWRDRHGMGEIAEGAGTAKPIRNNLPPGPGQQAMEGGAA